MTENDFALTTLWLRLAAAIAYTEWRWDVCWNLEVRRPTKMRPTRVRFCAFEDWRHMTTWVMTVKQDDVWCMTVWGPARWRTTSFMFLRSIWTAHVFSQFFATIFCIRCIFSVLKLDPYQEFSNVIFVKQDEEFETKSKKRRPLQCHLAPFHWNSSIHGDINRDFRLRLLCFCKLILNITCSTSR